MPTLYVTYKHPELRDGEVFLSNFAGEEDYLQIGYKTKRRGLVAYDWCGQPIPGVYPVFVSKEEYKQIGGSYKKIIQKRPRSSKRRSNKKSFDSQKES